MYEKVWEWEGSVSVIKMCVARQVHVSASFNTPLYQLTVTVLVSNINHIL